MMVKVVILLVKLLIKQQQQSHAVQLKTSYWSVTNQSSHCNAPHKGSHKTSV